MGDAVYIVLCDGLLVAGAYKRMSLAERHSRTITGASVMCVQVLDELPDEVLDQLVDDFEESDTPVTDVPFGDLGAATPPRGLRRPVR